MLTTNEENINQVTSFSLFWKQNKFSNRNPIKEINNESVSIVSYSWSFLNWARKEITSLPQKTRKLMKLKDDTWKLFLKG